MSAVREWVEEQAALVYEHKSLATCIVVEHKQDVWQRCFRPQDPGQWPDIVEKVIQDHLVSLSTGTHLIRLTALMAENDEVLSTFEAPYRGKLVGHKAEKTSDGPTELAKAMASIAQTTDEVLASARGAITTLSEESTKYRELCFQQQSALMALMQKDREAELEVIKAQQATIRMNKALETMGPGLSTALGELVCAITAAIQSNLPSDESTTRAVADSSNGQEQTQSHSN